MTISKDENGNICLRQGDSGTIIFRGFNPEKNYYVHFSVVDEDRKLMFPEIVVTSNNSESVTFNLDAASTKQLIVPEGEEVAVYYWGVKYSEIGSNEENTIFPKMFKRSIMLVCPQYTEGVN